MATNLPALDAPNRVGGRVKPGHDAKPLGDLSDAPELIVTNSKRYKRQSYGSYRVSCWFERSRLDRFRGWPGGGVLGPLTRLDLRGICLPLVWSPAAGPAEAAAGGRERIRKGKIYSLRHLPKSECCLHARTGQKTPARARKEARLATRRTGEEKMVLNRTATVCVLVKWTGGGKGRMPDASCDGWPSP